MSPFWAITFLSLLASATSQSDSPSANLSSSWINRPTLKSANFSTIAVRIILLSGAPGPTFACGFYCNGTCSTFLFSIFIVHTDGDGEILFNQFEYPQLVWSANRNNPVRENATLQLTPQGDLVLRDADGSLAWSTDTAGRSVAGLNLTGEGNLVLFDSNDVIVWQSFDHPTDSLVPGQILESGKNLTAAGSLNTSTGGGMLYAVTMTEQGLVASVLSDPPQVYLEALFFSTEQNSEPSYAKFERGSLTLSQNSSNPLVQDLKIPIPLPVSAQYMKLGSDGHLRVFEWANPWKEVADLLTADFDKCSYPLVCGKFGVCSDGQCSCPDRVSFLPVNERRPNLGCYEVVPLTCNATNRHTFLDLDDVNYFSFNYDIMNTDKESCKRACLRNCSCKAAVFQPGVDSAVGGCYLPNEIFSLMHKSGDTLTRFNSTVSLKVQKKRK